MEIPLLRITTSKSADFESVSNYYYNELVIYVGKVLQVIPEKMFKLLWEIVHLQTTELKEVPLRLDKDQVIEMAQLDTRMKVSKLFRVVTDWESQENRELCVGFSNQGKNRQLWLNLCVTRIILLSASM